MSVWPSLLFSLSISVGLLYNHHLPKDPNNNFKRLKNGMRSYPETIKFKTTIKLIIIGLLHQLVILFSTVIFHLFIEEIEHFSKLTDPLISEQYY